MMRRQVPSVAVRAARTAPLFLAGFLALTGVARASDPLPSWNDTAPKQAVVAFVERVTKEGSPEFVPPSKRIATFFEAMSSERLTWRQKFSAFRQIWRPPPRGPRVRKRVAGGDEPSRRSAGQPAPNRSSSGPGD